MSENGHVPIRMCIGCRKKRRKEEMVRFIQGKDGILFMDEKKRLNRRGFYLCPDDTCLKLAQKKIQMGRVHNIVGSAVSFDSRFPQKGLP
ncbi:MAG: hypothetical protein A2169_13750 [Deltaproteobacteria bacterium RBG_13_47_9]|nr:MAG: hypothetical protein A2169_13750 [Deltaproteobacteria bacterium RBG_13_47_9]